MASPVTINSSPTSIRLPTITPPSRQGSNKKLVSSSPALPSPSTFVKPRAAGLKSGSRSQALPAQAGFGFASAGSLWRENKFHNNEGQDEPRGETVGSEIGARRENKDIALDQTAPKETTGKLKKPSKIRRPDAKVSTREAVAPSLEFQDFLCDDTTRQLEPSPVKTTAPKVSKIAKVQKKPFLVPDPTRKPSVDLSDFTFGVYNLGMQTQAPSDIAAVKKSRKKTPVAKSKKDKDDLPKPRGRKAKSEAIILNSDDPVAEGDMSLDLSMRPPSKPVPKRSRAKKPKKDDAKQVASAADIPLGDSVLSICERALPQVSRSVTETSAYFAATIAKTDITTTFAGDDEPVARDAEETVQSPRVVAEVQADKSTDAAMLRRTDWTPVKDTTRLKEDGDGFRAASPSTATGSPKLKLADMLGDFSYLDESTKAMSLERSSTGEALTKRRRIELGDAAAAGPAPRKTKTAEKAKSKEKKKPAGRKKLQTITALATSAYQPPADQPADQSTVSEFFAPRKHSPPPAALKELEDAAAEKPKKPRKPRKKKAETIGDGEKVAAPKVTKGKVKFDDLAHRAKLYSPVRATEQMHRQDFVFGTSSQLAVDESPTFIRDMQAALHASEMEVDATQREAFDGSLRSSAAAPSQVMVTPRKSKSCAKVPTAPHGTYLSLEQADRALWCVASRDDEGGFLREPAKAQDDGQPLDSADCAKAGERSCELTVEQSTESLPGPGISDVPEARFAGVAAARALVRTCDDHQAVVNLKLTSPSALADAAEDSAIVPPGDDEPTALPDASHLQHDVPGPNDNGSPCPREDDDTWMLISSDDPPTAMANERALSVKLTAPNTKRLPTPSPTRQPPNRRRHVLQLLDGNASMTRNVHTKGRIIEQDHAFSGAAKDAAPEQPTVKPRGRPRKDAGTTALPTDASPKRRGRPPKHLVIASDPSPESAKFKKPQPIGPASQPTQPPSSWLDVDEIYDSDPPVTPSPPRRRASLPPTAVSPLDLTVDGSPLAKLKDKAPAVIAAASTFKASEPQWPAIRADIFPKIATTVKTAPRSTDPARPTWYQKILMYDPITLEELTGWLNGQGLRISVQKQKPKAKKKGRKKKGADSNAIEEPGDVEWETHDELLQPWMVQKWCEEKSICCVWAGGGWGGRKQH